MAGEFEKSILVTIGVGLFGWATQLLQAQETLLYGVLCALAGFLLIMGYTFLVERQAADKGYRKALQDIHQLKVETLRAIECCEPKKATKTKRTKR